MVSQKLLVLFCSLASLALGHMEMKSPPPRKSQFNLGYGSVDYGMNSPLGTFPCKGFPAGPSVASFKSGSPIPITLLGTASHNGGHCQFSLSYDGGNTFVVIKTIMNNCMLDSLNYSVQIPDTAPSSDKVVLAWSWINKTGNREFYMNCADISIQGTTNGSIKGPKMLVANLPGYPTIPEFTDGGYDGSDLYSKMEQITVGNGNGNYKEINPVATPNSQPLEQANKLPNPVDTKPNRIPNDSEVKPKVDYSPNQIPNKDLEKPKVDYSPNLIPNSNLDKPKVDYSNVDYSKTDFSNIKF